MSCFSEDNPKLALDYVKEHAYSKEKFDFIKLNYEAFSTFSTRNPLEYLYIDFLSSTKKLSDPIISDEISVIIIDKTMPGMDGLEFCDIIRCLYPEIKLILLTGTTNLEQAIDAFNKNLIDKYIPKDNVNLIVEQLQFCLSELTSNYFFDISNKIIAPIRNEISVLELPVFKNLFFSLFNEHNISKYCLIDIYGSFLLISKNNKPYIFLIRDERSFEELIDLAESINAPDTILQKMKSKQVIPLLKNLKNHLKLEDEFWKKLPTTCQATM